MRDTKLLVPYLGGLLNAIPEAAFLIDSTARVVMINNLGDEAFGYSPDELIGKPIDTLVPPRFREAHKGHCADYFAHPKTRPMGLGLTLAALRKDGSEIPVEISLCPLETDAGSFVLGVVRDISESEERYRAVFDQMAVAVTHTNVDGQALDVNQKFCEMTGFTRDEALTRGMSDVLHPDDLKAGVEARARLISERGFAYAREARLICKDGTVLWTHVTTSLVRGSRGRPLHFISIINDISQRKHAEEELKRAQSEIKGHLARIEQAMYSTVGVMATIVEMRDPYTHGHERRVAEIAVAIGAEMGIGPRRLEGIRIAGYLHDVGKVSVPAEILSKPTRLTPAEFALIKGHAQNSYEILKAVQFDWPIAQIAWQHHERLDGSGYPQGLEGEQILLDAKILSIADTVEAMASHRPYRAGLGIEKALKEIEQNRGKLYEPSAVDACLRLFREKSYQMPA